MQKLLVFLCFALIASISRGADPKHCVIATHHTRLSEQLHEKLQLAFVNELTMASERTRRTQKLLPQPYTNRA